MLHSKQQFQLGLLKFLSVLIIVVVGPFTVWRYLNGEYLKAALDAAIIVVVTINMLCAIRTQSTHLPITFAAIFYSCAAVVIIHLNGYTYAIWLHPLIVANFLLLPARSAALTNGLAVAATMPAILQADLAITAWSIIGSIIFSGSMAYSFARLTEQQRRLLSAAATEDALTQLGNRRLLDEEMERCIADFQRNAVPVTLIILDLDHFKQTNDTFGHAVGDKLLVSTAVLLKQRARKTDRVFRYGGEEFVMLARGTTIAEAEGVANDLRRRIEETLKTPAGSITASFGCSQLKDMEDARQWFERADQAMFRAKEQGRNRVVLAT